MKSCQEALKYWNKIAFGNVQQDMKLLKSRIETLSKVTIWGDVKYDLQVLRARLEELEGREDQLWCQRNKAHWYKDGDRNTSYFHACATSRRRTNAIKGLVNDRGIMCTEAKDMEEIIVKYFSFLFTSSSPSM